MLAVLAGNAKVNDTKSPVGKETKSLGNEEKGEDGLTPAEEIASEFLSRDQDNWEMADENQDGDLKEDEFLTFQHPEQNRRTVVKLHYCMYHLSTY